MSDKELILKTLRYYADKLENVKISDDEKIDVDKPTKSSTELMDFINGYCANQRYNIVSSLRNDGMEWILAINTLKKKDPKKLSDSEKIILSFEPAIPFIKHYFMIQ